MANYRKDKLTLSYNKAQKDFVVAYPRRCDGALALNHIVGDILRYKLPDDDTRYPYNWIKENFKDELEKRGYDLTTLKFSIELKKETINSSK